MRWVVGVQTCPREVSYLENTLKSIERAGWSDICVFAEPGSQVPSGYRVAYRPQRYGDWTNWIVSLFEMFSANPETDCLVLFEDDIKICVGLREYLDWSIPKLGTFGCLSLYTHPKHHCSKLKSRHGWHNEADNEWALCGTQAIVFTYHSLMRFLSSSKILLYRHDEIGKKNSYKDCAIGKWACNNEKVLYHTPSLVEHMGQISTLETQGHVSLDYVGDDFDARSYIGQSIRIVPARSEVFL